MRIVHLPFYDDNPYQTLLMNAQRELGHEVWEGGGGGNFIGMALREWKADLVHFHWLHPYLLRNSPVGSVLRASRFLAEVALLKASGSKVLWTIHNLADHGGKHAGIERLFTVLFAAMCSRCFVHSQAAAHLAEKHFHIPAAKLTIIPHGSYLGVYPNNVSRSDARTHLALPQDARVFLFLGRIKPYKGVFELIDAFKSIAGNCHLVIAGKIDDDIFVQVTDRIGEYPRIHLHHGRISDNDIQIFFNAADVAVFPFRRILTSGSLVLAMSFGKAVVAPYLPSLEEALPEAGVRWFDSESGTGLEEAMSRWLIDNTATAGAHNLAAVRQWDWTSIAKTCLEANDSHKRSKIERKKLKPKTKPKQKYKMP